LSTKSCIYELLRLWNDAAAVRTLKLGKRTVRGAVGTATGRVLRKLLK